MKKKYEPVGGTHTYEPDGGKHLDDVAKVVAGLAKKLGFGIVLVFSGTEIVVGPKDKPNDIVDRYHNRNSMPRCGHPAKLRKRKPRRQRPRRQKRKKGR